jgi:tripartite-type tricarboxylate transporter receptor subunit TctC
VDGLSDLPGFFFYSSRKIAMKPSMTSRRRILAAAAAAAVLVPGGAAWAQSDAPLHLVVTFPPGGSTDIAARIIQPELEKRLGRPVVIENKPGAASQLATSYVAR